MPRVPTSRAGRGFSAPGSPAFRPVISAVPAMSPAVIAMGRSQVIPVSVQPAAQCTVAEYRWVPLLSTLDSAVTVAPVAVPRRNCTCGSKPGRRWEAVIVASIRLP